MWPRSWSDGDRVSLALDSDACLISRIASASLICVSLEPGS